MTDIGWGAAWPTNPVISVEPRFEAPPHIVAMMQAAKVPLDKDGLLQLQQQHKKELDKYKESEMELRKLCAKWFVPKPEEGVNNVDLGNGYTAKIGINYNYKLDESNDKIEEVLDRIAKIGNEGAFIADRIVTWTPNFHVTEYRKLQEDAEVTATAKAILKELEAILTITDKAPTLEVKAPKVKK